MEQIGYDMYCKLLNEVVLELKGEVVEEEQDVQIDLNVTSYIPEEYIENSSQKIEVYQNIALCKNEEDIQNVVDEVIDRYGPMPSELEDLLDIARIKNKARENGMVKVMQRRDNLVYFFDNERFNFEILDKMLKIYKNRIKFTPGVEPYITFKITDERKVLEECKEFLGRI